MSLIEIVKDSVAVAMPCAGAVEPRVVQSMCLLSSFSTSNGYPVRFVGITERTLIHTARSFIADAFLKTECEWLFWMDSDMILEPRTIPVMINWAKKLNAKFMTGIYYQRLGKHYPLILRRDGGRKYNDEYEHSWVVPNKEMKTPFKVHSCGFGCVLTHRDVFLKMEKPFFKNVFFKENKEVSEDFYFCSRARKFGVDLWAVPELRCGHIGTSNVVYAEDFKPDMKDVGSVKVEI